MLCHCATLFWIGFLSVYGVVGGSRVFINRAPKLSPEDSFRVTVPGAVLADQATGVSTFVHLSDVHVTEQSTIRHEWDHFIDEAIAELIRPDKIIITGDLVENMDGRRSIINQDEWKSYIAPIKKHGWEHCTKVGDLRGNHDATGVLRFFSENDLFVNFSSCGFLKKYVYSLTQTVPTDELFLPSFGQTAQYSFAFIDSIMEPSLAQPFNYFGGYPQNGRGEMGNRDRQRDLMTELLDLKRDNSMGTFLLTHQPTVLMNNPLRSDLLSYMQTEADEFGNIFALLNGHLHEHDVDRILYTSSSTNKGKMTRASPELNVPAFSHSHSFRLFTIDHGILEYSDHQHRPISRFTDKPSQDPLTYVTVLNPPSSEHMTSRTQWHLVQNSTHIRVMVYTQFKNPHVRAVIVPGHVPYAHVTADGIFPFMFAPEPIPNAVWFDLHKTTAPNPNDLPLYVAPWNSTQFRSSRFYTLYVTVAEDSDAHFKYSSSDLVSKPVLFNKNSSVFFTTKPHPFSVSGFTKTPRVSLLRTGVQLPLTQWTRLIILTLSIILITTLLLSRFVPLFAYCLSLSKDRYLRKESRKQLTTPDAEHNANSLVVPPAHKDSFRTRYLTAIADVISEPTPFLVASDFNPKAKSPFVSRRSRMAAFLHLDALLPDSYYLLPHSFATKVDRFRRRMKMVRKVRKELKQAKQNAKQAAIPQDEMGDMPFTPSSPVPEQGPQLNASPTRGITLSVPLPNFPDRLLQWLVLQLYPYYRLPIAGLLIIVAVIFVFASFPIIRGNPLPPLLPVRLFIFKNQQGTMSNHAIDTAQLMWMVYLGFSVFPLIVFVAHTGASRAPPIAPSDKRPFNIYRRLVLPLFLGWNELLPVYRTRSAIPTPLLLVYWISGYAFSIVIIKFIAPLGASFLLSLLAIPSIAITAVLHAASIVGYLQSKKLDSPRSES